MIILLQRRERSYSTREYHYQQGNPTLQCSISQVPAYPSALECMETLAEARQAFMSTGTNKGRLLQLICDKNDEGQYYILFNLPKQIKKAKFPRPYCVELCGLPLKRVHWTCIFCRTRKVFEGKLPAKLPIDPPVYLFPYRNRRFRKQKAWLTRRLFNLVEMLAC